MTRLGAVDLTPSLSKKEGARLLARRQERLTQLRLTLGGQIGERRLGPGVLVLFEGWDASGKGGAIKRLVAPLDPRHVRVRRFAAPTFDERRQSKHYARVRVVEAVIERIEEGMRRWEMDVPAPLR